MRKYLLIALTLSLLVGCSSHNSEGGNDKPSPSNPDQVSFKSLNWTYGGFNCNKDKLSEVRISSLKASGNNMSYHWNTDVNIAVKGLGSKSKTEPDLLACFFVKNNSGKWVGGKFEWISVSRSTRQFGNINNHYNGWTLDGVPNPCDCAFIIVNPSTKVRTNIIKSSWKR